MRGAILNLSIKTLVAEVLSQNYFIVNLIKTVKVCLQTLYLYLHNFQRFLQGKDFLKYLAILKHILQFKILFN